jgi:hypothetical protein
MLEKTTRMKNDQDSDLNPDEPAELSENDFDAIAPGGRQRVADRRYVMRQFAAPFDPVRPVIKSHSDENPRQDGGNDSKTVYFDVVSQARVIPVGAIHFRPPVWLPVVAVN